MNMGKQPGLQAAQVLLPSSGHESKHCQRRAARVGAVANVPVLQELLPQSLQVFPITTSGEPESALPYTCNYQAKRLGAWRTAELGLLPTQHKEALTSTRQPTCAGEGNNYIFILSVRHLLTFLHTAAKGQARTDGSHGEDGQGGTCQAWSKHLPTAPALGTVLLEPLPAYPGKGDPAPSHPLCATREESTTFSSRDAPYLCSQPAPPHPCLQRGIVPHAFSALFPVPSRSFLRNEPAETKVSFAHHHSRCQERMAPWDAQYCSNKSCHMEVQGGMSTVRNTSCPQQGGWHRLVMISRSN